MDLEERTLYYVPTTIKKPVGSKKLDTLFNAKDSFRLLLVTKAIHRLLILKGY